MASDLAPRKLLLAAIGLSAAAIAFLIGARAGASLDKVMTYTGQSTNTAALIAR